MDTRMNERMNKTNDKTYNSKSVEEKLFMQLMHAPHVLRGKMWEGRPGRPGEGCGKSCGRGPEGRGPHGPFGPGRPGGTAHMDEPRRPGFGPEGHGGHGCGHGPEGRGPHGPHGKGHRRRAMLARERILGIVLEHEDGIRQKDIAEQMHIGPSALSEMITKLEIAGYLERKVDPSDKRATLITLTEVGTARAYELQDERAERFGKLFGKLTDEEKAQLLTLLEKLNAPEEDQED